MGEDDDEVVNACNVDTNSRVLYNEDNTNGKPSSTSKKRARVLSAEEENREESVLGFLVELRACNHKVVSKAGSDDLLYMHVVREKQYKCMYPVFVYFTGSVAAWRPVLSSLFGKCVTITGLKRKLMVVGEGKEEYNVFVATRTSVLSLVCPENYSLATKNESYREHYQLQGDNTYHTNRGFRASLVCNVSKAIADMNNGKTTIKRNDDILRSGKNGVPVYCSVTPALLTGKLNKQRQSRTGSYVGTVTGIHMQGLIIEIDKNVWLLLTHQPLAQIHGLRIGVLLALRHVHFIKIEFTWEKILLLGACFKSHIVVKSFSPLRTPFNARPYAGSSLSRFIESLSFTAGFWVLLVTACFRHKFHGIFSEKEILGSKNREGMVQRYVCSWCSSFHSSHRDVFKEFFNHDCSCPVGEPAETVLQLIAPINKFCRQIEAMWVDQSSIIWKVKRDTLTEAARELACGMEEIVTRKACRVEELGVKKSCRIEELGANKNVTGRFVRQIISGKNLGVVLVGILQVSQDSGQLQLVDATGAVDVVVPDFVLHSSLENFYEVKDFNVVVEGFCEPFCSLDTMDYVQPLSCAGIIDRFVSKHKLSSVTYYVHFYLKKAVNFNVPRWPVACLNKPCHIKMKEIQEGGIFWIMLVTHKYAFNGKQGVDKADQNVHSSFAEAIVLPYSIVTEDRKYSGHNRDLVKEETRKSLEDDFLRDIGTNNSFEASTCLNTRGNRVVDTKRFDYTNVKCMCNIFTPNSCDGGDGVQDHPASYFYKERLISEKYYDKQSEEQQKLQCSLVFRNLCREDVLLHGNLFMLIDYLNSKEPSEENPCLKKVLLEFGCQSLSYYQLLQIGGCYLIQCQAEDCSSDPVMAFPSWKSNKVVVSSHNPIWSLSIASYHQITKQSGPQIPISSINDFNTPPLTLQFCDMNEPANINYGENGRSSTGWHGQASSVNLRDVMLYIPCGAIAIIQEFIEHVKSNMIPIMMGVYDALEKCLACRTMEGASLQFSKATVSDNGTKFEGNLPEGELISLHGEVNNVLCKELNPFLKENRFSCKCLSAEISSIFLQKVMYTIHIQGSHGSEKICLRGIFNKSVLPLGFGPGVTASFYRVLLQSDPNGEQELLVTPASSIVVKATKEVQYHAKDEYNTEARDPLLTLNDWHIKDSILVSCLSNSSTEEVIRLCCRVVSVQSLVLEWQPGKSESACSLLRGGLDSIQIISGTFILDDGSGLCDCWASGIRAAHLLSIYSTAGEIFEHMVSLCKVSKRGAKKAKNTVGFFLEKLAKKHQKITVQKNSSVSSSHAEFMIQGALKEILNPEEQALISFILARACDSVPLVITGSILNSPDQQTGEQKIHDKIKIIGDQDNFSTLTECRRKILARNVSAVNYLQEAGNIFEELASEI